MKSFRIVSRGAILAAAVLFAVVPWSASHGAVELVQFNPPNGAYPQTNIPPRQPNAVPPPSNTVRPPLPAQPITQGQNAPRTDAPAVTESNTDRDIPSDGRRDNGLLPGNPTDALRRAQQVLSPLQGDVVPSDLPFANPTDALRRAQQLSSPTPRDFVPTGLSTPSTDDGAGLGDQIRQLGTSIPNAEVPVPELRLQDS